MTPAPQRAQRVRGIPGVGLRTSGGREWVRDGSTYAVVSGMRHETCTVRFCGRPSKWGNPYKITPCNHFDCIPMGDLPHTHCKAPTNGCGIDPHHWMVLGVPAELVHDAAMVERHALTAAFGIHTLPEWPDSYFTDLLGYDFLSCFCPLDQPCHVDAIIAEGVARGIWTPSISQTNQEEIK